MILIKSSVTYPYASGQSYHTMGVSNLARKVQGSRLETIKIEVTLDSRESVEELEDFLKIIKPCLK